MELTLITFFLPYWFLMYGKVQGDDFHVSEVFAVVRKYERYKGFLIMSRERSGWMDN